MVNESTLVEIALQLDLGSYLFLENGEEKSGGRTRASILADSLEAIFAAVSFDSDFNAAKAVIEQLYWHKLTDTNAQGLIAKDSKSILQEYLQERYIAVPKYNVIETSGPDHDVRFKVECNIAEMGINVVAEGKSKKEASQLAADRVLLFLKNKHIKI